MWYYNQYTGVIRRDDTIIGACYSGSGAGLNSPQSQAIADIGPIPRGRYTIGAPFEHPQCGPLSMRLTPVAGTNTFGRDGFLMHGDNKALNHTASHGCIIADPSIRAKVASSGDRDLTVI